jgi:hypothetical protein
MKDLLPPVPGGCYGVASERIPFAIPFSTLRKGAFAHALTPRHRASLFFPAVSGVSSPPQGIFSIGQRACERPDGTKTSGASAMIRPWDTLLEVIGVQKKIARFGELLREHRPGSSTHPASVTLPSAETLSGWGSVPMYSTRASISVGPTVTVTSQSHAGEKSPPMP